MAKSASSSEYLFRLAVLLSGGLPVAAPTSERDAISLASDPARPDFLSEDRHRALFASLADLPIEQRRVLVLRYFGDHSDREISTLLRMPQSEVRAHALRALGKLRSTAIPSRDRTPRDTQTLLSELRSDELWDLPDLPAAAVVPAKRSRRWWLLAIPAVAIVAVTALAIPPLLAPEPSDAEPVEVTLSPEVADNGELAINDRGITVSDFPNLDPAKLEGNASTPWAVLDSATTTTKLRIVYAAAAEPETRCGSPLGVSVVETSFKVTIAAVSSPGTDSADCVTNARYAGGTVYLAKALGDRQLVHAGLSAPWDTLDSPIATAPRPVDPAPEPTPEPTVYQDKVYLTSEGMGDLRLGKKIPHDTKLVYPYGDSCSGWLSSPPFDVSSRSIPVFSIETTVPRSDSPLKSITIVTPEIPTKSGARVGDSEQALKDRFPDLDVATVKYADGSVYVIAGTTGKVLFYVGTDQIVTMMQLVPIDAAVPYTVGSACGA